MSVSTERSAAAPPPRTGGHWLAIAVLGLALIVLVSVITIWVGVRFLARGVSVNVDESGAGAKKVSIKTPVGSLDVAQDVDVGRLGLPVYPGAARVKGGESATVNMTFGDKANLRVLAAKFETEDDIEKVRDFYMTRLGDSVTKFTDRDREGNTVFELKKAGQERVVALHRKGTGTEINLVRVVHGTDETN
jgi:hypothetical protein